MTSRTNLHPTVSVIIPTFNRAAYVVRAVQSALQQEPVPEVIVIDDGSTDDTERALAPFAGRIIYVKQPNLGVVAARNRGLILAQGSLIAFLDSDDFWFPGKLALQLRCFEIQPDMVLNCTNAISMADDGRTLSENFLGTYPGYRYLNDRQPYADIKRLAIRANGWFRSTDALLKVGDLSSAMFMGNFILTPTVLVRTDVLCKSGMFDPSMGQAGEDYDFFWRVSEQGPVGLLDIATTCVRRLGSDHLATSSDRMALSNLRTIEKYLARRPAGPDLERRLISRRMRESYAWIGITQFDAGDMPRARVYLLKAVMRGIFRLRVLVYLLLSLLPSGLASFFKDVRHRNKHRPALELKVGTR